MQAVEASSDVNQVVLVGHGVELYNLGKGRQISYFSVYDQQTRQWLSYQLPRLSGGESGNQYLPAEQERESCALVGTPCICADGSIYIGAAGGVLNRLTPNGQGGYRHSYALLQDGQPAMGQLNFVDNSHPVTLLARGDDPVSEPVVRREVQGVEIEKPFFQSYREQTSGFNMLVEQGLVSPQRHEKIWTTAKRKVCGEATSIRQGLNELSRLPEGAKKTELTAGMLAKDGPFKDEVIRLWERNNDQFPKDNPGKVLEAADRLMPGLSAEWQDNLYTEEGKWKIYDERLPVYRVCVGEIPDAEQQQLVVAVMGNLYRLTHSTGELSYIGKAPVDGSRHVDTRGVVALDSNTFVLGDMGVKETVNGPQTLRVVVDQGNGTVAVSHTLTQPLLDKLSAHWQTENQPNRTPRVKALVAGKVRQVSATENATTLFLRTKHAGNDLVEIDVSLNRENGTLKAADGHSLSLTDTDNNEFICAVGNTLLSGRETEDYTRTGYLPSARAHLGAYKTGKAMAEVKSQAPEPVLPALPAWVFYSGYGYDGISACS